MFGQVWTWAGRFRRSEKNIGCKSYYIPIELKQLLDDAKFWYANKTYLPEELAIRFKHRLVNIHCFSNGNGRHSRLIADLIVTKIYNMNYFTWGSAQLGNPSEIRTLYISALRKADAQDYRELLVFARN